MTLCGRDIYLGSFASAASRAEYDRLIAEWLANGRISARSASADGPDLTINELLLSFVRWAEAYYRKGGRVTGEVTNIKYAIRSLRALYGHTRAKDFGPLRLKTVRQTIIGTGICGNEVNRRIRIVTRAFKWTVSEDKVPPSTHHRLQAVSGLRRGRCEARGPTQSGRSPRHSSRPSGPM